MARGTDTSGTASQHTLTESEASRHDEFDRFEDLARKLVHVPKRETRPAEANGEGEHA
jgi:hypothetical protein